MVTQDLTLSVSHNVTSGCRSDAIIIECKIQLVEIIIFTEATVVKTTEPGLTWPTPGGLKVGPWPDLAQWTQRPCNNVVRNCISILWAYGMQVPGNESSWVISLRGAKVPGNKRAWEWMGQGAKGPESESSRERIGHGSIGWFAPGSEVFRGAKWPGSKRAVNPTEIHSLFTFCFWHQ